jgi:hypothetical protein
MAAHKHQDCIVAWAGGAQIQAWTLNGWVNDKKPTWNEAVMYRIQPAEPERVYPVTRMTGKDMQDFIDARSHTDTTYADDLRELANHVLRHACDASQIVTREEMQQTYDEMNAMRRKRAERDMVVARAVRDAMKIGLSPFLQTYTDGFDLAAIIAEVKP